MINPESSRCLYTVGIALALSLLCWTPVWSQCTSCAVSESVGPFEDFQLAFSPSTLGLSVGETAPQISGVVYADSPTVLVAGPGGCDREYLPLLKKWSQVDGIQVVYARALVSSSSATRERAELGEEVLFLGDPRASIVCAQFQVGNRASPVTFLIDTAGTIVYRRRGFPNYDALNLTVLVEHFALHDEIPANTLPQHVLWYGDDVPEPPTFLHDRHGEPQELLHGSPTLIYSGSNTIGQWPAYEATTALMEQFPDVRFVMVLHYKTEESLASIWEFGRLIGLDRVYPEWYAISLDEFLLRADFASKMAELDVQAQQAEADGWEVVYDPNNQLVTFWLLYALPSVMIYGANGEVAFPCTAYALLNNDDGTRYVPSGTADVLAQALEQITSP